MTCKFYKPATLLNKIPKAKKEKIPKSQDRRADDHGRRHRIERGLEHGLFDGVTDRATERADAATIALVVGDPDRLLLLRRTLARSPCRGRSTVRRPKPDSGDRDDQHVSP